VPLLTAPLGCLRPGTILALPAPCFPSSCFFLNFNLLFSFFYSFDFCFLFFYYRLVAKVLLPLISVEAHGSLSKSFTFRNWKSIKYASLITTHADARSPSQLATRSITSDFSQQMRQYLLLCPCYSALRLSSSVFGSGYSWFFHLLPLFRQNYFPGIMAFPYFTPWIYPDPNYVYVFFPRRVSGFFGGNCLFSLDSPSDWFSVPIIQHWTGEAFFYWPKTHGPDRTLFVCPDVTLNAYWQFGPIDSFLIPGY